MQVLWTDGLSLLPHHLQVSEREIRQESWLRDKAASDRSWGVVAMSPLECDGAEVQLRSLFAIMPDGTVIEVPRRQAIPRRALPSGKSAAQVSVYVAIPEINEQRGNVVTDSAAVGAPARFRLEEVDVQDVHGPVSTAARIQVGREEVRIVFDNESEAGFVRLKVGELERDVGGQWVERAGYVPPSLRCDASRALPGLLRGLSDRIHGRLANANPARLTALDTASPADAARLFQWNAALASAHAELRHVLQVGDHSPEHAFTLLLRLASQLSILQRANLPMEFPAFRYEDLAGSFGDLVARIVPMLDPGLRESFKRVDLVLEGRCFWAPVPEGVAIERFSVYLYLGGVAAVGGVDAAQLNYIKLGSRTGAIDAAKVSIPGVGLSLERAAPAQLPDPGDGAYLRLEKQGRRWEDLVRERTIGLVLTGVYEPLTRAALYLVPA